MWYFEYERKEYIENSVVTIFDILLVNRCKCESVFVLVFLVNCFSSIFATNIRVELFSASNHKCNAQALSVFSLLSFHRLLLCFFLCYHLLSYVIYILPLLSSVKIPPPPPGISLQTIIQFHKKCTYPKNNIFGAFHIFKDKFVKFLFTR